MKRSLPALLVVAMLPLAFAHSNGGLPGTPKTYCETLDERSVHDYGPATAVGGASVRGPAYDGNLDDCNGNGEAFDFDGHREWGAGWARLLAADITPSGGGSLPCYGELSHHSQFPLIFVKDIVLGRGVVFNVMADGGGFNGSGGACGDGQVTPCDDGPTPCSRNDFFITCIDVCAPTFPPGLDGAYIVVVQGYAGHVIAQ